MSTIKATGTCFETSACYLLDHRDNKNLMLCHGLCIGTGGAIQGKPFVHAWLEDGALAIDVSTGAEVVLPREIYYFMGKIDPERVVRYDYTEAKAMMLEHMHYGSWEDDRWPEAIWGD